MRLIGHGDAGWIGCVLDLGRCVAFGGVDDGSFWGVWGLAHSGYCSWTACRLQAAGSAGSVFGRVGLARGGVEALVLGWPYSTFWGDAFGAGAPSVHGYDFGRCGRFGADWACVVGKRVAE